MVVVYCFDSFSVEVFTDNGIVVLGSVCNMCFTVLVEFFWAGV